MQITKDEFLDKYGNVKVKFDSYYKYMFRFRGELPEGGVLYCSYGGDADDIYRFNIDVDKEETVSTIDPNRGSVYKDDEEVLSFDEWANIW
jgi:hypothetical protein